MKSLLLSLVVLSLPAIAAPPVAIELQSVNRVSSMQQVGTQAGSGGALASTAYYQLYWEQVEAGRAYDKACFAVASGTHSGDHHIAGYRLASNGRPGVRVFESGDISIGSGAAVYCLDFDNIDPLDPTTGVIHDSTLFDSNNDIDLTYNEAIWLVFERDSGSGTVSYRTMYNVTSESLGQIYPGGSRVLGLTESSFSGFVDNPTTADSSAEQVIVSLEVTQ